MLVLLKLAAVLALIIVLLRFRWNLGFVLVLASAVTGLFFGLGPEQIARDTLDAAIDLLTLQLVAIVLLITLLGEILRSTLQLEGLIRSLGDLFTDRRWLLVLIPMLIGMLPMVGGAMFSAPMVDEVSRGLKVDRDRRTFLNYWFRHVMEPVFPLYPSLVVAAGLMGVSVQTLTRTQWPLFVSAIVAGLLFGLVGIRKEWSSGINRPERKETLVLLLKSIWPIALVLILAIAFQIGLIISLLVTIGLMIVVERLGPKKLWKVVRKTPVGTAPIILGAMIFRYILETSSAIEQVSGELSNLGIPVPIIVFAVPLLAALLTGLALPGFAIGFPIVFPLVGADVVGSGYGMLAYAGGMVGVMLSPMHLCLALTRVYFKAEWGGIYRRLIPAALLVSATGVVALIIRQM